jgi:hypothetical protein
VFYDALGHFPQTWGDPRQLTLVTGGIAWAAGLITPPSCWLNGGVRRQSHHLGGRLRSAPPERLGLLSWRPGSKRLSLDRVELGRGDIAGVEQLLGSRDFAGRTAGAGGLAYVLVDLRL